MARASQVQKAVRKGQKARIALSGPTGAGKSFTTLIILRELVGPDGTICIIDTERGSASLYSDEFEFDTIDWAPPYDPREIADDLATLAQQYDGIGIDSLTHFWQGEGGTLDIVEASAVRSGGGNKFAGWKTGTPAQNAFVEAMLQADCHIVATMRSKMEHVLEENAKGQKVPKKVGMAPIQRDGIEYEFTVGAELDQDHRLLVTKSRCSRIADQLYQGHQAKDMAAALRDWLESPPIVDLSRYVRTTVPDAEMRKVLAKEWKTTFDFTTTAVPTEQEQVARQLIDTYKPLKPDADHPKQEEEEPVMTAEEVIDSAEAYG